MAAATTTHIKRSQLQVIALATILSKITLLSELPAKAIKRLTEHIVVMPIKAQQIIYAADSIEDCLYYIASGLIYSFISSAMPFQPIDNVAVPILPGYKCIANLNKHNWFGITSLSHEKNRKDTIIAEAGTILFAISKTDIKKCKTNSEEHEFDKLIFFLKSLFYFSRWSNNKIAKFLKQCRIRKHLKGEVITEECHPSSNVYIIKKGEFVLSSKYKRILGERSHSTHDSYLGTPRRQKINDTSLNVHS